MRSQICEVKVARVSNLASRIHFFISICNFRLSHFRECAFFVASQFHQIQCDKLIYEEISLFH